MSPMQSRAVRRLRHECDPRRRAFRAMQRRHPAAAWCPKSEQSSSDPHRAGSRCRDSSKKGT